MKKKGFQLSLNVIVVAILALIVLVSSTMFFANKFGITSNELGKCASLNGDCVKDKSNCNAGRIVNATCPGKDVCCVNAVTMAGGTIDENDG